MNTIIVTEHTNVEDTGFLAKDIKQTKSSVQRSNIGVYKVTNRGRTFHTTFSTCREGAFYNSENLGRIEDLPDNLFVLSEAYGFVEPKYSPLVDKLLNAYNMYLKDFNSVQNLEDVNIHLDIHKDNSAVAYAGPYSTENLYSKLILFNVVQSLTKATCLALLNLIEPTIKVSRVLAERVKRLEELEEPTLLELVDKSLNLYYAMNDWYSQYDIMQSTELPILEPYVAEHCNGFASFIRHHKITKQEN